MRPACGHFADDLSRFPRAVDAEERRWRLQVSDAVYVAFLGASQNTSLRRD